MGSTIQIRPVPDDVHRTLEARAAIEGLSPSDRPPREIRSIASRPSPDELPTRLSARAPVNPSEPMADAVRAERDTR